VARGEGPPDFNSDGQYYADGSTGYKCKWYPGSYELWVGP
jgi:hypothetical protein